MRSSSCFIFTLAAMMALATPNLQAATEVYFTQDIDRLPSGSAPHRRLAKYGSSMTASTETAKLPTAFSMPW